MPEGGRLHRGPSEDRTREAPRRGSPDHPRPSLARERRAEITERAKRDSLLSDQEAVCLQVVASHCRSYRCGACAAGRRPRAWRSPDAQL